MRESQPILLIGSPMCTAFSTWQKLNDARPTDVEATQRAFAEACRHIKFVSSLYQEQLDGGRYSFMNIRRLPRHGRCRV